MEKNSSCDILTIAIQMPMGREAGLLILYEIQRFGGELADPLFQKWE
jgi:hypothetical protein